MTYTEFIPNFNIVAEPVVSKIRSKSSDGSGCVCHFYKLDEKRGLKLYESRYSYNETVACHKIYAEHFPAPKIYEEGLIFVLDGITYYGYIVEIAEVVADIFGIDMMNGDESNDYEEYVEIRVDLARKFEKEGFDYSDFHAGNIGRIGNKWMLIDFGGFYKC